MNRNEICKKFIDGKIDWKECCRLLDNNKKEIEEMRKMIEMKK